MSTTCQRCQYTGELTWSADGEAVCPGCGSSSRMEDGTTAGWAPTDSQRRYGKFELLHPVGAGAFGTVYEARDTELDRIVAIKVPRTDRVGGTASETDRFLREARSAA